MSLIEIILVKVSVHGEQLAVAGGHNRRHAGDVIHNANSPKCMPFSTRSLAIGLADDVKWPSLRM